MALSDPEQEKILAELTKKKKKRKYRNVPTLRDGILFDSKAEADRWSDLKLLEMAGEISDLKRQVLYKFYVNGMLICGYRCDFRYRDREGKWVVEDVKSVETRRSRTYRIKFKLMKALYKIKIKEVIK